MAWALGACGAPRLACQGRTRPGPNLLIASLPIAISRRKDAASSGQIFDTLSKPENLQHAFAGGGKGLARAAARPALAKTADESLQLASVTEIRIRSEMSLTQGSLHARGGSATDEGGAASAALISVMP